MKMNRRTIALWVVIVSICPFWWTQPTLANEGFSLCRSTDVEWMRFELVVGGSLPAGSWYVADGAGDDGTGKLVFDALPDGTVTIGIPDDSESGYLIIEGNASTPTCDSLAGWQPGAPSIPVQLTSDCAFVEIRDVYGNWHLVTSDGEPVLLHYGESLIGSNTQSTNADDYRAVVTACY